MHNSMLGPILPSGNFLGERFYRIFEAFYCMSLTGYSCHFQNCKNFWNRTSISWVMTPRRSGPPGDALCTPPASRPAGKWAVMGRESAKITQNRPFLPQYRPDMAMIWSHMASIPMSISHTTSTSPMCPPLADILAKMGRDMLQISQISLKISHF